MSTTDHTSDPMADRYEPAETVTECHEAPDVAELRRLAENATPGPWVHEWVDGDDWWAVYGCPTGDMVCPEVCTMWGSDEAAYIAAANPAAVLGLLDRLAHMREARDNARTEVERLTALLADQPGGGHQPSVSHPGKDTILPELLAAAWDEGHHAGHEEARAVHPTYPDPTPNPYRQTEGA